MMLGGIVIWYRSSVPLRNSAPQPYFSTRTTPRVLPTANPSAARLSIVFGENRSSTFHMMGSGYDAHRATVKPCPGTRLPVLPWCCPKGNEPQNGRLQAERRLETLENLAYIPGLGWGIQFGVKWSDIPYSVARKVLESTRHGHNGAHHRI